MKSMVNRARGMFKNKSKASSRFIAEPLKRLMTLQMKHQLMIAFLVLSLVPLILLGVIIQQKTVKSLTDQKQQLLSSTADGIQNTINQTLNITQGTLKALTAQPDISVVLESTNQSKKPDPIKINTITFQLSNAVKASEDLYETLFIVDRSGNVIADGSQYKKIYAHQNIADQNYFLDLMGEESFVIGRPTFSVATDRPVIPVALAINTLADKLGAIVVLFDLEKFTAFLDQTQVGETGYPFILNQEGLIIYHKVPTLLMNTLEVPEITNLIQSISAGETIDTNMSYTFENTSKIAAFKSADISNWLIGVTMNESEFYKEGNALTKAIVVLTLLSGMISIFLAILYANYASKPLMTLPTQMHRASSGNLSGRLNHYASKETYEVGKSFNAMMEQLSHLISFLKVGSKQMDDHSKEIYDSSQSIFHMTTSVSDSIDAMHSGAQDQMAHVLEGEKKPDELDSQLTIVGDKMDEIVKNAEFAYTTLTQSLGQLDILKDDTKRSNLLTHRVQDEVKGLSEEVHSVHALVETITKISKKTNLLAINAAIEAAHSGEMGRGFSVIADEIRKLSYQVEQEANDIRSNINSIDQKAVGVGLAMHSQDEGLALQDKALESTQMAFNQMAFAFKQISSSIEEIHEMIAEMQEQKVALKDKFAIISAIAESATALTQETQSVSMIQLQHVEQVKDNVQYLHRKAQALSEQADQCITAEVSA